MLRKKNIALDHDISLTEEEFMFDEDKMEQVFTNLIDNALRHTSAAWQCLHFSPFCEGWIEN